MLTRFCLPIWLANAVFTKLTPLVFIYVVNLALMSVGCAQESGNLPNSGSAWQLWKKSINSSVSYRKTQYQGLIAIKAKTTTNSSLSAFLLFLQDLDNVSHWLDHAIDSRVIKTLSPSSSVVYTRFNSSWPISDREMVIKSHHWQNDDLSIEISIEDAKHFLTAKPTHIMIDVHYGHWLITPINAKQITIEYSFLADPNGAMPSWLINHLTLQSTWTTINNIQKQLPLSAWQTTRLANIKEPD